MWVCAGHSVVPSLSCENRQILCGCGIDRCALAFQARKARALLVARSNIESNKMKKYSYIFLKRGLIPEQVAIQAAHVSMVLGDNLADTDYNPAEINFIMTPMSMPDTDIFDELEMMGLSYVDFHDYEYTFVEGKLTQSDTQICTAIMTYPIGEDNRRWLRMLPLYRIK
jgi:hypothetical protein